MKVDVELSGHVTAAWREVEQALRKADFAKKIIIRYVILPRYDERIRFRVIRNDGRPSELAGMSLEQFYSYSAGDISHLIMWTADTYLRGCATPLSKEKQGQLGRLLREKWDEWAPIIASVMPENRSEMRILEIIDDLARLLQGNITDPEMADFLQFASLQDIRAMIVEFFPDEMYQLPLLGQK